MSIEWYQLKITLKTMENIDIEYLWKQVRQEIQGIRLGWV